MCFTYNSSSEPVRIGPRVSGGCIPKGREFFAVTRRILIT
jgi:hypothetical protein